MTTPESDSPCTPRFLMLGGALFVLIALVADAPALRLGFDEIDDSLHLLGARDGFYASPHFRPLHQLWNLALFTLCGARPLAWHLAGFALHCVSAWLVFVLALRLTDRKLPAIVAGATFATWFAPCEVVIWVSAHTSTLAVCLVLACAVAFVEYLRNPRAWMFALTMVAMILAVCTKEDGVVLGVLLPALDLARRGAKGALSWRRLRIYVPFAIVGVAYLAIAFRPELWSGERTGHATYGLRADIVPRVFASLGWTFIPKVPTDGEAARAFALFLGCVIPIVACVAAWRWPRQRALVLVGLVTAIAGFLPTAPGPFELLTGRYAYASSLGAALLLAAAFEIAWEAWRSRALRVVAVVAAAGWLVLNVHAVWSLVDWRFAPRAARLEHLVTTTADRVLPELTRAGGPQEIVVVPSAIWNDLDYTHALQVFLGLDASRFRVEHMPYSAIIGPDGLVLPTLDPTRITLFTSGTDGVLARAGTASDLPLRGWAARAKERVHIGLGNTLPVVHFHR